MILSYFKKVRAKIQKLEWLISFVSIATEYDDDAESGIISGSITFKDRSVFHFKEIFIGKIRHYRFHYMDEKKQLICRWDTAPHHRNLKTFPYHIHLPEGVKESNSVSLVVVLDKIKELVVSGLEKY